MQGAGFIYIIRSIKLSSDVALKLNNYISNSGMGDLMVVTIYMQPVVTFENTFSI